jgi:arsenite methyltransferase
MLLQLVARQFRQPSGFPGHFWGWLMNRGNAHTIAGAIDALATKPDHDVLEIGFGGGAGLRRLLAALPQGTVTGTELSDVMLTRAGRTFADALARKRLHLVHAAVEELPLDDAAFDGVVTINTVYFWSDPKQGLSEISRVLRPGGCVVLGISPPEFMRGLPFTRHGFTIYEPQQLEEMLRLAGFTQVRTEAHNDRIGYICVMATKPAS